MVVCNLMKYQIFLVQTVERILIKNISKFFCLYLFLFCILIVFSIGCLHEICSFKLTSFNFSYWSFNFNHRAAALNRARLACCLHKSCGATTNFSFSKIHDFSIGWKSQLQHSLKMVFFDHEKTIQLIRYFFAISVLVAWHNGDFK